MLVTIRTMSKQKIPPLFTPLTTVSFGSVEVPKDEALMKESRPTDEF
jgi:hypothetical protein